MTKYSLISVTADPRYECMAPLSAHLWRLAGWTPLVLVMGSDEEWAQPREIATLREFAAAEARIVRLPWLPVPAWSHNHYFHAATACRRPAAALLCEPDDYVVLGDADMLLLDPSYLHIDESKRLQLWCYDAYGNQPPQRYPSCYQGATAATWADILTLKSTNVAAATIEHMEQTRSGATWLFGEQWDCEPGMQAALAAWPGFPGDVQFVPTRGRSTVNETGADIQPNSVDLHVRGVWNIEEKWDIARDMLTQCYGHELTGKFDSFRQEWLAW